MSALATALATALAALAALVAVGPRRPSVPRRARRLVRPARRWSPPWPAVRQVARRGPAADPARLLDELGRRVRGGASLGVAVHEVATDGPLLAVARLHRRGIALAEACRPLADDPDHGVALTAATLCLLAGTGGAAGRALDAAAGALRERAAVAADVRAQAATARLSALVLVALPVGFAAWSTATNPAARRFLFGSALGWSVAGAGLGLDAVGAWWMQRLVRGALWT